MPAELQKPGRSWPPSALEPPSQDRKILTTCSMYIHNNSLRQVGDGFGWSGLVLYLIGIHNQKDALACRNRSRYFITEVNMTLQRGKDSKIKRRMEVQRVINGHKNWQTYFHISFWSDVTVIINVRCKSCQVEI